MTHAIRPAARPAPARLLRRDRPARDPRRGRATGFAAALAQARREAETRGTRAPASTRA